MRQAGPDGAKTAQANVAGRPATTDKPTQQIYQTSPGVQRSAFRGRMRVERLAVQTQGTFAYGESVNLQQIHRREKRGCVEMLRDIYRLEASND